MKKEEAEPSAAAATDSAGDVDAKAAKPSEEDATPTKEVRLQSSSQRREIGLFFVPVPNIGDFDYPIVLRSAFGHIRPWNTPRWIS